MSADLIALPGLIRSVEQYYEQARIIPGPTIDRLVALENQLRGAGATLRLNRDPATISLAGVRSSCTAGLIGLTGNWLAAARRALPRGALL